MNRLLLVRHSLPHIDPNRPANEWSLSEEGRRRCQPLAARLSTYRPDAIVSSLEHKAIETAEIVAGRLGLSVATALDLHEHDRRTAPHLSAEQFEASVAALFAHPAQRVFGAETADQAHRRFAQAVEKVARDRAGQTVAIVAHGTVITLFVSRLTGSDPLAFWKHLGLPSFVVLSLPEWTLQEVVASVPE